jgi:oxygen-dependent protoporphyrinogen oxidase
MVAGQHIELTRFACYLSQITTDKSTFSTPLVISTLSSTRLDQALPSSHPIPHLNANRSATVSVVTLVFPAPATASPPYYPAGFGYLIPRSNTSNPNGVIGCVFDSSAMGTVDPPAVQEKVTKFTLMIGGPHYIPGGTLDLKPPANSQDLIPIALAHLRKTLPDLPSDLEPIIAFAETHKDCIPTYAPGHGARMRELGEKLAASEWSGKLMVAGASYGGVSLIDCVNAGMSLAERIVEAEGGSKVVTGLERWATWE